MVEAMGLRERKKAETRRLITEVALQLAAEHGPDSITVDDIAAAADVSPRTVFNHFGTKDEAILGIDPERRRELSAQVAARPAGESPIEAIFNVFVERMTSTDDAGRFWMARAELVNSHPHLRAAQLRSQEALERDLALVVAERTGLHPDADPYPLLVSTLSLSALRLALARAGDAGAGALRREMRAALAALSDGLAPPPRPRGS